MGECFYQETQQWFFPELEDETATWIFKLHILWNEQARKKGGGVLTYWSDGPDYQERVELLRDSSKKNCFWNLGDFLGVLLSSFLSNTKG